MKKTLFALAMMFAVLSGTGFVHAYNETAMDSTSIEHHYNGCGDYQGHGHGHGHGHGC